MDHREAAQTDIGLTGGGEGIIFFICLEFPIIKLLNKEIMKKLFNCRVKS